MPFRPQPYSLGESEADKKNRFKFTAGMTDLTAKLTLKFFKCLPEFDAILLEDRITLFKSCSGEILMLRASRKYDIETDRIIYADNKPHSREDHINAGVGYTADDLFNFCRSISLLRVDNAEYALITAIVIFSGM